jgi:hypothetical protein
MKGSWQTDWGVADCECGKVCTVLYITAVGTDRLGYFVPLTERLKDEFHYWETQILILRIGCYA